MLLCPQRYYLEGRKFPLQGHQAGTLCQKHFQRGQVLCLIDFHSGGRVSQHHCSLFPGSIPVPLVLLKKEEAAYPQSHLAGVHLALESGRARREESEMRPKDICIHVYTRFAFVRRRKVQKHLIRSPCAPMKRQVGMKSYILLTIKTSDEAKPTSSGKMEHVVKAALLKSQTRLHEHVQFK